MWKRLIISLFIIIAVLMGSAIALDRWISWKTAPYVYDELQELPHRGRRGARHRQVLPHRGD